MATFYTDWEPLEHLTQLRGVSERFKAAVS
jgi:hypothetical protein